MLQATSFLDNNASFGERIYCYLANITSVPTCKICNNTVSYNKITKQYSVYCSNKCVGADGKFLQKKKETSQPNYFYCKGTQTISRYKAMKHKLSKILSDFNNNLSEYQNMTNHGYHRVWDCGNILYKLTKD